MQVSTFDPVVDTYTKTQWETIFKTPFSVEWLMELTGVWSIPVFYCPRGSGELVFRYYEPNPYIHTAVATRFSLIFKNTMMYLNINIYPTYLAYFDFHIDQHYRGLGIGSAIVQRSLATARQLPALCRATVIASGTKNGERNGYYSWGRWGFDGVLDCDIYREIPRSIKFAMRQKNTLQALMAFPEGRQWWRDHGRTMALSLSLHTTSCE